MLSKKPFIMTRIEDSYQDTTSSVNIQDIPLEKVRVGDIDVAYKMFGKGNPILLFNGASDGMDAWDPSFLTGLSSNQSHSDCV
jgi:hypothetical protein